MTVRAPRAVCVWWFPVSYLAHAMEEYCCGDTFPVWISRVARVDFTSTAFLWLNGIALVCMLAAAWLASHEPRLRPLAATLATICAINGGAHAIASIATASYSPGLVTGVCVWLPLGGTVLLQCSRELPRRALVAGVLLGVLAHALVSAIVLTSGKP